MNDLTKVGKKIMNIIFSLSLRNMKIFKLTSLHRYILL